MDTLATHPLTKKAEGELAVDVVVYSAGHFPVARHVQQLSKLGIKSLVSGQDIPCLSSHVFLLAKIVYSTKLGRQQMENLMDTDDA